MVSAGSVPRRYSECFTCSKYTECFICQGVPPLSLQYSMCLLGLVGWRGICGGGVEDEADGAPILSVPLGRERRVPETSSDNWN